MRLVLDTNTVLSGLLWQGSPGALIDAAIAGTVELCGSTALLDELHEVLHRPKFTRRLADRAVEPLILFGGYAALITLVVPALIAPTVLRDPDDDMILATALAARADLIVSGDLDLLDLGSFAGIEIVPAAVAMERL